jgi:TetR/AcrR family transcriptional repressor of bet genes
VPRQVDHEARRDEIADVAAALIANHGPEGVSLRSLAAASGGSTTSVTHYFADRREVLRHAYRAALRHASDRVEAIGPAEPDRLRHTCEAVMPLDDARRQTWQTWLAFHGVAAADPVLADLQSRRTRDFRALLARLIADEQARGTVDPGLDPGAESRELLALVQGISTQAAFDPEDWPAARQRASLWRALDGLRGCRENP